MQVYHPSDRVAPLGLILLVAAVLVVGGVLGVITYYVSTVFYLIFVMPFVIGLVAGKITGLAVKPGHVRSPVMAGIAGILLGLVMYGTYRYLEYEITFHDDLRDEIQNAFDIEPTDEQIKLIEDEFLDEEIGTRGFVGYVRLDAKYGFQINNRRSSSDSGGLTIKGTMAWLYWIIEIGLIGGMAYMEASGAAKAPYSEATGEWFENPQRLGTLTPITALNFTALATSGDFAQAGLLVDPNDPAAPPRIDVVLLKVSNPNADRMLVVHKITPGRYGTTTKAIAQGLITLEQARTLTQAVQQTSAATWAPAASDPASAG